MTLSPVFRSDEAVRLLREHGILDRVAPTLAQQLQAVHAVRADLVNVIGERFRTADTPDVAVPGDAELAGLQDYFFLTLFLSVFEGLGVAAERIPFYAELNFCIKGTITAADNLFDDQAKSHLPLRVGAGARYNAILQLMCFERLIRRTGDRAVAAGLFGAERFSEVLRGLLDMMAEIGLLEGSEEDGVSEIPTPEAMIERVHRVRGGLLFGLAMVAPAVLEDGALAARLAEAGEAIQRLGTAFQIVDDLTDFEFDLTRRSHNLLVSRIHHCGTAAERERLGRLWAGEPAEAGLVEGLFLESARAVLEMAYSEARASFGALAGMGWWFPAELAEQVVHAIVGMDGVARMNHIIA